MRCYARQLELCDAAQDYLVSRGISAEAARRLGLGYSSGHGLHSWLTDAGFDGRRVLDSGLVSEGRERFRGMIVIPELVGACPVLRHGGRIDWLAGRAIYPQVRPRFQALPGVKPVLGLSRLPAASPWIIVTEGLFDWVLLAGWGLPAVAALGTQGMDRLASSLQDQPRVFLAFDSDEAGRAAASDLAGLLGAHRTRLVTLPRGVSDVGELGRDPHGRTVFLSLLNRAARAAR